MATEQLYRCARDAVESHQGPSLAAASQSMSRNFYILAATLVFFALISGGMALVPSTFQPGLPANGSLWRTVALILLLAALASALIGVMTIFLNRLTGTARMRGETARRRRRSERN